MGSQLSFEMPWQKGTAERQNRFREWFLFKIWGRKLCKEKLDGSLFSEYEKFIIQNSWSIIAINKESFGLKVYRRIFECEPQLKLLFGRMDIEDDQMEFNTAFRKQAQAITEVIDKCVRCIDQLEVNIIVMHISKII